MEFLISCTRSWISGTGWTVIPIRRSGRTNIPMRAFISMMSIFTTTIALGICFIPWRANRTGTSWRTILNSINHRTLLWLKWWIIFLPPVRRHWARRLCLGRAPLSPVRRLRSLRELILTRGTPPLWRSHSTLTVWRWTDFRSQNLGARWDVVRHTVRGRLSYRIIWCLSHTWRGRMCNGNMGWWSNRHVTSNL